MPSYYHTRSATRKQAVEADQDTNFPPSNPPESGDPSDRPQTPYSDDEGTSSAGYSTEVDEGAGTSLEVHTWDARDRSIIEREMARLESRKKLIEERAEQMRDVVKAQGGHVAHTPEPIEPIIGPKLPVGIRGLGRNGTWVADTYWRSSPPKSTTELPTIREPLEEQEGPHVQSFPVEEDTRERSDGHSGFGRLTPLPSFVTGDR